MSWMFSLLACMGPWRPEWNLPDTSTPEVEISGVLSGEHRWTAETVYRLTELTFVADGAKLRIDAGTTIVGEPGSALIVTRGGRIEARGTASAPVVFTSAAEIGSRQPGDWGGLSLLGAAPVLGDSPTLEGLSPARPEAAYGGDDLAADCGLLTYVRIEFAGEQRTADDELNGLTLAGCGDTTVVERVQVHFALDDGLEIFGGAVELREILVTRPGDDGLDWDRGWVGQGQSIAVLMEPERGDNAIEADNLDENHEGEPASAPTLYNLSLLGGGGRTQRGAVLRTGTGGALHNVLIDGFGAEALDVRDETTATRLEAGGLELAEMILHNIGADGTSWFADERAANDDAGFDELGWFSATEQSVRFGADPLLPRRSLTEPDLAPAASSPAASGGEAPPEGELWDEAATWIGAFEPGSEPWYTGWASFPEG